MTNTPPGPGRSHVPWIATACLFAALTNVGLAEDAIHTSQKAVVRGQSTYGVNWLNQSLPPEPLSSLRSTSSPWIMASQDTAVPYGASPPVIIQQGPADPFGQPPGGMPMYGDPGLGGIFVDQAAIWQPYVAVQGKAGNYASSVFGQLMMPLYQDGQSLIFADIRGRFDDQSNSEGNFGLALRSMVDPTWFWGIYGFYDYKRTDAGNNFSQGTLGIEAMSVQYEARLNGYIPESGSKKADDVSTTEFEAGTIFVKGGLERAYYGIDGEVGALLWEDWGGNLEFRGFLGGYWFDTNADGFPSVAGPKGRLEMRMYDLSWFGPESRLTLGVELQHDSARDTQIAGLARLEIPLGFFNATRKLTRLERRMLDRIVRDDDVITQTALGPRETGRDSLTGRLLNNVTWVNKTDIDKVVGGLPVIVAGANTPNTTVVVDGSAGVITAKNIRVLPDQVLRGGGFKVIGIDSGATATFGTRPTINNADAAADTIILNSGGGPTPADFATVADMDLIGGRDGVTSAGQDLIGVTVSGVNVKDAGQVGFHFNALDSKSVVQYNTATGSKTGSGFSFLGNFRGLAKGNISSKNAHNGFNFASPIEPLAIVEDNSATENTLDGFRFQDSMLGTVRNNTASKNKDDGFDFDADASGYSIYNGASVSGNSAQENVVNGFIFNGDVYGTVGSNTATSNGNRGFEFSFVGFGGKVVNNTASNNFDNGFYFAGADVGGGVFTTVDTGGLVENNIASRNGFDASGKSVNATANGFYFANQVAGTINGNQSDNNTQHGFIINGLRSTGYVANNSATGNGNTAFLFTSTAGGDIDGTVSANSANSSGKGYGFDFTSMAIGPSGRVMNNYAANNFKGGFGFSTIKTPVGAPTLPLIAQVIGNTSSANGFSTDGTLLNANANGFDLTDNNVGVFTGNLAVGNANNGFAKTVDQIFTNGPNAYFTSNIANYNGDKGYAATNAAGGIITPGNTGTGNVNGGDFFPTPP